MFILYALVSVASCFFQFVPDDLVTFELERRESFSFVEDIPTDTIIQCAYQCDVADGTVDVLVYNPTMRMLFSKLNSTTSQFNVNTSGPGLYKIEFRNRSPYKNMVSFAIDVHRSAKDTVDKADIDPVELELQYVVGNLTEVYYDHKFQQLKFETTTDHVKTANNRILIFTILETAIIIIVTFWQIWYIKRVWRSDRIF